MLSAEVRGVDCILFFVLGRGGEKEGGGRKNHCDKRAGDSDHACYCVVAVPNIISHDTPQTALETGIKSNNP